MVDIFSKEKRHDVMSKIKGKDTQIEMKVRHWLFHKGIRYRKNCKDIIGKPDIAIKKYKIAIFVHGCFWHGHENCKLYRLPESNREFWKTKIEANIFRDCNNIGLLKESGWNVYVLWECQIKSDFEKNMCTLFDSLCQAREKVN